jgi:hypothetical protein
MTPLERLTVLARTDEIAAKALASHYYGAPLEECLVQAAEAWVRLTGLQQLELLDHLVRQPPPTVVIVTSEEERDCIQQRLHR